MINNADTSLVFISKLVKGLQEADGNKDHEIKRLQRVTEKALSEQREAEAQLEIQSQRFKSERMFLEKQIINLKNQLKSQEEWVSKKMLQESSTIRELQRLVQHKLQTTTTSNNDETDSKEGKYDPTNHYGPQKQTLRLLAKMDMDTAHYDCIFLPLPPNTKLHKPSQ